MHTLCHPVCMCIYKFHSTGWPRHLAVSRVRARVLVTCHVSRVTAAWRSCQPQPTRGVSLDLHLGSQQPGRGGPCPIIAMHFTMSIFLPAISKKKIAQYFFISHLQIILWKLTENAHYKARPCRSWWVPDTNMENMEKLSAAAASCWAQLGRCCTQMRSLWHFPRKIGHFVTLVS